MTSTSFINGTIICVDEASRVITSGYVQVVGERIASVGEMTEFSPSDESEILDCTGKFVFPGLINTHTHSFQTLIRGLGEGLPVWDWFSQALDKVVGNLRPSDAYTSAQVTALESIRSGATCVLDYNYPHPYPGMSDRAIEGFRNLGMRTVFARGIIDTGDVHKTLIHDTESEMRDCETLINQYHRKGDGLIRIWLAPYTIFSASPQALLDTKTLAEKYKTGITIHAATPSTLEAAQKLFGMTDIEYEQKLGILGPNVLLVHCTHPSPSDVDKLTSAKVCVSHNPASNAYLGEGAAPVVELLRRGITVGLGTDGAASNNNQDMLSILKLTALIQKLIHEDPSVISAAEVLYLATMGGAKSIGWDDEIGSIEAGKRADLFVLNPWLPNTVAHHDPIACLVYSATQENIETVMINGDLVMLKRKMTHVNEEEILQAAQLASVALLTKSGF